MSHGASAFMMLHNVDCLQSCVHSYYEDYQDFLFYVFINIICIIRSSDILEVSYFPLALDFLLLLHILLQNSMETLHLVVFDIIVIVVELISISCIHCSGYFYGTGSTYSNVKLLISSNVQGLGSSI